mgnify:CR=1 FL=1
MALNQRRVKILHLIREDGHAKVQDLSKIFNVTDVTIRQDLEALEQMGYIQREHGGAFLKGVGSFAKTGHLFNQTHLEEKKEIAQKAIQFIQEGDSIILDSGSTTTEIAKLLMNYKDLTVITNALNIALILGENIADHGCLQVSFQAFKNATKDAPLPVKDGFTPEQRFFLSYAGVWAGNIRDEQIRLQTKSDPHSLGRWRVNGALPQIDAWYDAFGIKEGDPMYLAPEKRVSIW